MESKPVDIRQHLWAVFVKGALRREPLRATVGGFLVSGPHCMARNRYYVSQHYLALKRATHQRDGWKCTVPGCGSSKGLVCEHIKTRPNVSHPTEYDVLSNTTSLCSYHDRQTKEKADGSRRNGGKHTVKGCNANGTPIDPMHPWSRP
jgi:hypothetical protein